MTNPLDVFLQFPSLRYAALGALLVAVLCGTLGVFVVLRGLSMLGDGIAHISFAGVALGLVLGFYPLWIALAFAVLGALAIHFLREREIVRGDAAIGILFTAGLSVGILVLSANKSLNVNVESYLFGSLLAIRPIDVAAIALLGGLLLVALVALYKELFYVTFSEEAARISGLPVKALNVLFIALTAASIVIAARIVGVLLVSALLVVPAATSLQLARSFRTTLLLSVAFATASVLAGLAASATYGVATGASIALASTMLFAVTLTARLTVRRLRARSDAA